MIIHWVEQGSIYDSVPNTQHIMIEDFGGLVCGVFESVCDFANVYQPIMPAPIEIPPQPRCIGATLNLIVLNDKSMDKLDIGFGSKIEIIKVLTYFSTEEEINYILKHFHMLIGYLFFVTTQFDKFFETDFGSEWKYIRL